MRLDFGEFAREHTRPGQLVKLHAPGHKAGYFALGNAPRGERLTASSCSSAARRCRTPIDVAQKRAVVEATAPFGEGFPVERARGRDVLLFAAGSGITPIRALLQYFSSTARAWPRRALLRPAQRLRLRVRRRARRLARAGVHLVLCASQPSPAWTGARGDVQLVARELRLHEISTKNAVLLCGMKSMIDGARGELVHFGLPAERTFLNFQPRRRRSTTISARRRASAPPPTGAADATPQPPPPCRRRRRRPSRRRPSARR